MNDKCGKCGQPLCYYLVNERDSYIAHVCLDHTDILGSHTLIPLSEDEATLLMIMDELHLLDGNNPNLRRKLTLIV